MCQVEQTLVELNQHHQENDLLNHVFNIPSPSLVVKLDFSSVSKRQSNFSFFKSQIHRNIFQLDSFYFSYYILFIQKEHQMPQTYSVELINTKGQTSLLSVKDKTEWKTRKIAEKHCQDIQFVIQRCGHFQNNIIANVVKN